MQHYRAYWPHDETEQHDGDAVFRGVNLRLAPEKLPSGYLADAENVRMTDGAVAPRLGVSKPAYLNVTDASVDDSIGPVSRFYGAGVFTDPNSREWVFLAADGLIYRCRYGNARYAMPMPHQAVRVSDDCVFIQAFNWVFCFRGRYLAPLILRDVAAGWTDVLDHFDPAATYASGDEIAYGPFAAVTSVTSDGDLATVETTNPHGYVTGADVTLQGANETEYNGRFGPITVLDENTFTFQFTGSATSPATGTITVSNMAWFYRANASTSAGDSPDSAAAKWDRIYNILPNAATALYINNRLLVPTAYTPSSTGYSDASVTYTKVDFLVATDVLDPVHFDFVDEFRINQGDDSEIVDLVKYDNDTVLVFKGKVWGILSNIRLDLDNVQLDMRGQQYGLCARGAAIVAGKDVYFVASNRGVVSLNQTQQGLIQSVDVPLSNDIEPWIRRINWNLAHKIRLAWWDNKLFVAVPMDDATVTGSNLVPTDATWEDSNPPLGYGLQCPVSVVSGRQYSFPGYAENTDAVWVWNGKPTVSGTPTVTEGVFTAADDTVYLRAPWGNYPNFPALPPSIHTVGEPVTAALYPVAQNVCNAILVYDFQNQAWAGRDRGQAICPREFFVTTFGGRQRLCFTGEDGYCNLYEEHFAGDMVRHAGSGSALGLAEIATLAKTRGYREEELAPKKFPYVELCLDVWNARFTVVASTGPNRTALTVVAQKEFSRTRYLRPFDRTPYDETNVNGDFAEPNRGNYAVILGEAGVYEGISGEQFQEVFLRQSTRTLHGSFIQFTLTNDQGRCQLKSLAPAAQAGQRRKGVLI